MFITEKERQTAVLSEWDVAVVGGGFAGAAAALAAARQGRKTLLIEREFMLGGLGTLGMVTIYLPLCDGAGTQVSYGIAEEFLRLSIRRGAQALYPSAWLDGGTAEERKQQRFKTQYNPWIFAADWEQLLQREGVEILYGTDVCGVEKRDGKITHLILENVGGRSAVAVKAVVDGSGNAVAAALAGDGVAVNPEGNVLSSWYYSVSRGRLKLRMFGEYYMKLTQGKPVLDDVAISGMDAWENSRVQIQARRRMLEDIEARRERAEGDFEPAAVPAIPDLRMTRRITGRDEVRPNDHAEEKTSIGCVGDWRNPGPAYEIPYGALQADRTENLWAAGRCIAAAGDMWDICRVIPVCAVTGEAAGIAAALSVPGRTPSVEEVQTALRAKGVRIHLSECRP